MNTLINYFESPTKSINVPINNNEVVFKEDPTATAIKNGKVELKLSNSSVKTKNQEIFKNMEEVMSIVKKKNKNKHKNEISKKNKHHKHHKNRSNDSNEVNKSHKSPLKENRGNSIKKSRKLNKNNTRSVSELLSPLKNTMQSALDIVSIKPKDIQEEQNCVINEIENFNSSSKNCIDIAKPNENKSEILNQESEEENKSLNTKVNAFEFLMNARNKSIGGNSPGKEEVVNDIDKINSDITKDSKTKRKKLLEEWADRKGAKKRKLEENVREQFIEVQLEKRAIRLKNLLEKQPKVKTSKKIASKQSKKRKKPSENKALNEDSLDDRKNILVDNIENKVKQIEDKVICRRSMRKIEKSFKVDEVSCTDTKEVLNSTNASKNDFEMTLSSPIKRRDNLYGYFEKTTPSPTKEVKPIKKTRKYKKKLQIEKKEIFLNNNDVKKESTTSEKNEVNKETSILVSTFDSSTDGNVNNTTPINGRPRRSCVGKIRQDFSDFDINISPKKTTPKKSKKLTTKSDDESKKVISIDITDSPVKQSKEEENTDQCRKLAPLFVRPSTKLNMDVEKIKARQDFLMSGIPEKMKIEIAKIKQFEQNYELLIEIFPKYNHIPMWNLNDTKKIEDWSKLNISWKNENSIKDNRKYISGHDCTKQIVYKNLITPLIPLEKLTYLEDKRFLIKIWKNSFDKFPTYKCYNQLREKYRYFSAMDTDVDTQQVTESFVVSTMRTRITDNNLEGRKSIDDDIKPPLSAPNGELLFSEKYKPLVSDQILVNLNPIKQLKEFLSNWQSKNKISRCDDSIEDNSFECLNDSNSCSSGSLNSVVLVGPISSGKTSAVFALANELNFNVLEINAGMKRSGKKLLQDLHEATQSHQIRKDIKKSSNNILLKKALNNELDNNTKMSLILVEDADILFDNYDQGFVDAIYQLVGASKRPVVILANDKNCLHLQRLINQNCIDFYYPNSKNISRFLAILSLIENCPIFLYDIISLYYYNNMDLRKTILEIQFFIQSGGDRKCQNEKKYSTNNMMDKYFAAPNKIRIKSENINLIQEYYDNNENSVCNDELKKDNNNINDKKKFYIHNQLFKLYVVDQNNSYKIPFPLNFDLFWINIKEIFKIINTISDNNDKNYDNNNIIKNNLKKFNNFYNNISIASNIYRYQDDCLINSMDNEISHYIVENSLINIMKIDDLPYNLFDDRTEPLENIFPLISTSYNQRNKNSIALDYEPMLRSICRSEKTRNIQKRGSSRYYHYLKSISSNLNSNSIELFDDVCNKFVDNPNEFIELKSLQNNSLSEDIKFDI